MADLNILGNSQVHDLLIGLSRSDIQSIKNEIGESLIQFSTGPEEAYQPEPGIVVRPDGQKVLFRPFTSVERVGVKVIVEPPSRSASAPANLQTLGGQPSALAPIRGLLAVCDKDGRAVGVINAEEVTGYRTSLSAMIMYMERLKTDNIVVFGAGMQALWHIRLALALRGDEIKRIHVINRSPSRAEATVKKLREENQHRWKSCAKIDFLASTHKKYESELERLTGEADAIFCTIPSGKPHFPASYIKLDETNTKGPYISAIGSWQPGMIELDPSLMRRAAEASIRYHLPGHPEGAVIVDDRKCCLLHTDELIQSKLHGRQTIAVGEILQMKQRASGCSMDAWLKEGFVIYKSVGVGVTDLAAGNAILSLAAKHHLGTKVANF
ncbi:hypothetical protein PFICI_14002 [Pestalotiopsis fici W106-1]|uniref:Ornithine cyclodeaminase n=1 Tax=Pestalotiopsis fici (strain W106-1 / CGMCC3.15140) TaxID=1229662 RepID=W3WMU1_PESFW|nr:uncharacterized protein PFICI_14002 [Pestalotiopsis fici W106-1]ETS74136.1 hypothetical protein PFICI_14002 [Pestalotiopsis fici W106-1]